jgi:hypothetical protein
MLDALDLNYFLSQANPVYVPLTLEFLSSLTVSTTPESKSTRGSLCFRMFNNEYVFGFDEMADILHFPHMNVVCEVHNDEQWPRTFVLFWKALTGKHTDSCEGNHASSIHNPAMRYFRQLLAGTIFGRANSNKVNSKELFYLFAFMKHIKINTVPFMFNHMRSIVAKRGTITFGGLITTIAKAIGLGNHLENLTPLPMRYIDLDMVKYMKLVKELEDGKFYLMINNNVFRPFVFPDLNRTDVRNHSNFYYPPDDEHVTTGEGTTPIPPAPTPQFSNTFAGSSSSYREQEERDSLFYAIHQQQEVMLAEMQFLRAQQTQLLQHQTAMHDHHNQSAEYHRQQLDQVMHELGRLSLRFDDFQRFHQPPP